MIVGNDLAGGKVLPVPEVIENPLGVISVLIKEDAEDLTVFPACVITRAQSRKFPNVLDLSDSFLIDKDSDPVSLQPEVSVSTSLSPVGGADTDSVDLLLSIDRTTFAAEQKQDTSLACCRDSAVTREDIASKSIGYFYEDGVFCSFFQVCWFVPVFCPSRQASPLAASPHARASRRSREFTPPFADQPAHRSQEMTPPSTANPSPPARR